MSTRFTTHRLLMSAAALLATAVTVAWVALNPSGLPRRASRSDRAQPPPGPVGLVERLDRLADNALSDYAAVVIETGGERSAAEGPGTRPAAPSAGGTASVYGARGPCWFVRSYPVGYARSPGLTPVAPPEGWPSPDPKAFLAALGEAKPSSVAVGTDGWAWAGAAMEGGDLTTRQMPDGGRSLKSFESLGGQMWASPTRMLGWVPGGTLSTADVGDAPGVVRVHVEGSVPTGRGAQAPVSADFEVDVASGDVPRRLRVRWFADSAGDVLRYEYAVEFLQFAALPGGGRYPIRWDVKQSFGDPARPAAPTRVVTSQVHVHFLPTLHLESEWFTRDLPAREAAKIRRELTDGPAMSTVPGTQPSGSDDGSGEDATDGERLAASLTRAVALIKLGRTDEALTHLESLDPLPGDGDSLAQRAFLRGWIHLSRNETAQSLAFFRRILDEHGGSPYATNSRELVRRLEPVAVSPRPGGR